jgi:DNA-directed RNA polymerase beta subunit
MSKLWLVGYCKSQSVNYININLFFNIFSNNYYCRTCPQSKIIQVWIPYACKLLIQELMAMHIAPRLHTTISG